MHSTTMKIIEHFYACCQVVSQDTRENIRCYVTSASQPQVLMAFLMGIT
jgi:hypothetical protein